MAESFNCSFIAFQLGARAQGTARHKSARVVSMAAQYCLRQCGPS